MRELPLFEKKSFVRRSLPGDFHLALNFDVSPAQFQIYPSQEADDDEKHGGDGAGQAKVFPRIPEGDVESIIHKQVRFAGDSAADHFRAAGGEEVNQVKIIKVESKT